MKKLLGIISYLPDNPIIREHRWGKLNKLILKCNQLFNLPIIIIAQNWKDLKLDNVILYQYENKLGIVGARKTLRQKFLESDYDYLIMLDDDCELIGNSGIEYLKQIDTNPDCFIEFNKTLLKLFAISKTLFREVNYEDINPEDADGFEDRIFVNKLRKLFPDKKREFKNTGLIQHSTSTADKDSTWYKDQDITKMLKNTEDIIRGIK